MITPETMRDWIAYANALSDEEITELITEFSKIQTNRTDDKRRAAAKKVIEAIDEYLRLGEEISICGDFHDDCGIDSIDGGFVVPIETTLDGYSNHDGYLTFNFVG